LGPEWLKQIARIKFDDTGPLALPPDLELSVEDARRRWLGAPENELTQSRGQSMLMPPKALEPRGVLTPGVLEQLWFRLGS
jgi:hypothetical protein